MNLPPTVLLYAQENVGLIIPWPSGVLYQQQTGGYSCIQSRMEGIFVPLYDLTGHVKAFEGFFTGLKWRGACDHGIDAETAEFIDATLSSLPGHSTIKVDRDRLADSHEAWIHVILDDPSSTGLLEGFATGSAILTWPNSD